MVRRDILEFISEDDKELIMRKQLEEAKLQTELLMKQAEAAQSALNNYQTTVKVDMSKEHTDEEVWHSDSDLKVNTLTTHAVDVEYWYALTPGERVRVPAGLIVEVSGHEIEYLYITNTETLADTYLEITLAGRRG